MLEPITVILAFASLLNEKSLNLDSDGDVHFYPLDGLVCLIGENCSILCSHRFDVTVEAYIQGIKD